MDNLSTIAIFDDLRRCEAVLTDGTAEREFLGFIREQENVRLQWLNAVNEAQRLQRELDAALLNMADLETKLYHARKIIEMETKHRRDAEHERDLNEKKINEVRDLVQNGFLRDDYKEKFDFLNFSQKKRKSTNFNKEINSTGSLLSDLSVTQSEEDFLDVCQPKKWKKHRPSIPIDQATMTTTTAATGRRSRISTGGGDKRKNSNVVIDIGANDKVIAHTKVSIPQGNEPILAESTIEAIPRGNHMTEKENIDDAAIDHNRNPKKRRSSRLRSVDTPLNEVLTENRDNQQMTIGTLPKKQSNIGGRPHLFGTKTLLKAETCHHCQKKIRFGNVGLKCRNCRIYIHLVCKDFLTLVCVPQSAGTPIAKGSLDIIGNYAPSEPPFVPAVIVHCVNEIETRGLNEVGIYRVSGSEKDIKALKERFLRGKTMPPLGNIDVHVLCGCVKDFLRGLREPLIPTILWKDFSNAVQNVNSDESLMQLHNSINKLPAANRDTLAFLILHFLRVANYPNVKMPISNIAKVFGPTIVGYSSNDPDKHAIFFETMIQANVMERLLDIPADYWGSFLTIESNKTDETDNVKSSSNGQYLGTPLLSSVRKKPFYATPPYSSSKRK